MGSYTPEKGAELPTALLLFEENVPLQEVGISVLTAEELPTLSPLPTDSRRRPSPHTVNQSPRDRPARPSQTHWGAHASTDVF